MTYTIEIINWDKHNPNLKKWHKHFLFYSGFFSSPKVANLTPNEINLFIYLMCIACESDSHQIRISSATLPKQLRIGDTTLAHHIDRFVENQLVTLVETQGPLKVKSKSKDKIKVKENKVARSPQSPSVPAPKSDPTDPFIFAKRSVWEKYHAAYVKRWGVEPSRNATVNRQISDFVKRIGNEDAPHVIEFYVSHKDSFYVKKTHAVCFALKDAESLHTQWKKNLQITGTKMREYERQAHKDEMIEQFELQAQQEMEAEKNI